MKRLPPTPPYADPATLRWVVRLVGAYAANALEHKRAVPGSVLWAERMDGRRDLARDICVSLTVRLGKIERSKGRRS